MFTEQQISILELFLKDHVTPKTGVMMQKNQFCITGINYVLIYIYIKKLFEIVTIFHNITVCTVFFTQINASLVSISQWRKICFTPDRLESKVRSVLLCFALFRKSFCRMVLIITVISTLSSFVKPTANAYALNCFAIHILYSLFVELRR